MKKLRVLSLAGVALVLASCSAGEYTPTSSDKEAYMEAVARTMGYEGDDVREKLGPSLAAQIIDMGIDTCETLRGDHDEAVIAFGLERATFEDGEALISAEDQWRLAIRHLCPDAEETFDSVFDDAW